MSKRDEFLNRFGANLAESMGAGRRPGQGGVSQVERPAGSSQHEGTSRLRTAVEIEVDRLDQLAEVLEIGVADVVLLDNMTTPQLAEAVAMNARRLVLEASGNMSLPRIAEVAATGVDYISVGALTHSAPVVDLGLDF